MDTLPRSAVSRRRLAQSLIMRTPALVIAKKTPINLYRSGVLQFTGMENGTTHQKYLAINIRRSKPWPYDSYLQNADYRPEKWPH
ncbi:hypothetical protein KCP74_21980 [Salmonella enterica subsp. enterica]|nr:hypothetical protein KCP74_21980 [Salmonella enterica subsp. enterica]